MQMIKPTLDTVRELLVVYQEAPNPPNLVPLCATIPGADLTPFAAYKKLSAGYDPRKTIKTGPGHGPEEDPLISLRNELSQCREAVVPGLELPPLTGGAIGYVGYDCVRYFEPRTARTMRDVLKVPESLFMLFDTIVAFDHAFSTITVITYIHVPSSHGDASTLEQAYDTARQTIRETITLLE
ncbi:MAG: hypothetical protein L6R39_006458, partial [Caloplaca ligustica]